MSSAVNYYFVEKVHIVLIATPDQLSVREQASTAPTGIAAAKALVRSALVMAWRSKAAMFRWILSSMVLAIIMVDMAGRSSTVPT